MSEIIDEEFEKTQEQWNEGFQAFQEMLFSKEREYKKENPYDENNNFEKWGAWEEGWDRAMDIEGDNSSFVADSDEILNIISIISKDEYNTKDKKKIIEWIKFYGEMTLKDLIRMRNIYLDEE